MAGCSCRTPAEKANKINPAGGVSLAPSVPGVLPRQPPPLCPTPHTRAPASTFVHGLRRPTKNGPRRQRPWWLRRPRGGRPCSAGGGTSATRERRCGRRAPPGTPAGRGRRGPRLPIHRPGGRGTHREGNRYCQRGDERHTRSGATGKQGQRQAASFVLVMTVTAAIAAAVTASRGALVDRRATSHYPTAAATAAVTVIGTGTTTRASATTDAAVATAAGGATTGGSRQCGSRQGVGRTPRR